jgi:murein DD-endopeptidase MepM/ murein hydrolase activator NlpD
MTPVTKYIGPALLAAAFLVPGWPGGMGLSAPDQPALAQGSYGWPVNGPVIRPYEAPQGPYGSGHRGIDIGVPFGSTLRASADGVVSFAGWVGGSLYISIDHPDGLRTTYSWLSSVGVRKGQAVTKGQVIGLTGHGHPEVQQPHLHFGVRMGNTYIDPLLLLQPEDVSGFVHLAPLDGSDMRTEWRMEAMFRSSALRPLTRGPPGRPAT